MKFAWSQAAAWKLVREGAVLKVLAQSAPHLLLPELVACSTDPVLLVSTAVPGDCVAHDDVAELSGDRLEQLAAQLGEFLAGLHRSDVLVAAEEARIWLPAPRPQATTDALRHRFGALVDESRYRQVCAWCDWVDDVLAPPTPVVLLHGDFGGHNLVWDPGTACLRLVADFEESSRGDPNYDLRYLPSQSSTLKLLNSVVNHYTAAGGMTPSLSRVMAWHVRTVLGDALWRSEAQISLPGNGNPAEWVDQIRGRLVATDVGAPQI